MRYPKSCYILRKWAPSGAGKACGKNWVVGSWLLRCFSVEGWDCYLEGILHLEGNSIGTVLNNAWNVGDAFPVGFISHTKYQCERRGTQRREMKSLGKMSLHLLCRKLCPGKRHTLFLEMQFCQKSQERSPLPCQSESEHPCLPGSTLFLSILRPIQKHRFGCSFVKPVSHEIGRLWFCFISRSPNPCLAHVAS